MSTVYTDAIASEAEYVQALLKLRDKKNKPLDAGLPLLKCIAAQPNYTITATRLAQQLGLANYGAANLCIGVFAHELADQLGYKPPKRTDGSPRWWTTIAIGKLAGADTQDEHFEFILRPELLSALLTMKWIKPQIEGALHGSI